MKEYRDLRMFHTQALRNVMTTETAWDIDCNIKWFYYVIWPIVILCRYSCTAPWWWSQKRPKHEGEFY